MSEQVKFAKTTQTKYDALVSSNSVDSFKFYFYEDTHNFT